MIGEVNLIFFFFFFLLVNKISIQSAKKGCIKVHTMYTTTANKCQKKERENKKYSLSQTEPNQSIKSTKDIDVLPINKLIQDNKLHKNKNFNL